MSRFYWCLEKYVHTYVCYEKDLTHFNFLSSFFLFNLFCATSMFFKFLLQNIEWRYCGSLNYLIHLQKALRSLIKNTSSTFFGKSLTKFGLVTPLCLRNFSTRLSINYFFTHFSFLYSLQ